MDTSAWLQIRRDRVAYAKASGTTDASVRRDLEEIAVVRSALRTDGEAVARSIAYDFDVAAVRELRAAARRASRQLSLWKSRKKDKIYAQISSGCGNFSPTDLPQTSP